MNNLCQFLEWDSQFFGFRIARASINTLTDKTVRALLESCHNQRIDCLYFLSESNDKQTTELAEANYFHMVDIRITLLTRINREQLLATPLASNIEPCHEEELPVLRHVAKVSYSDSRFYYDGHFSQEHCSKLYEIWLEKSFASPEQLVLVSRVQGQPVGYITCQLNADGSGQIGLLGVGVNYRGQGIGVNLIGAALHWFSEQGIEEVTVVTQGRNIASQRAYQRQGFLTQKLQIWYHRWFS